MTPTSFLNSHYNIPSRLIMQGLPPADSYWARPNLTREALAALVAARKSQQAVPNTLDAAFDPSLAATLSLLARKAQRRYQERLTAERWAK